MPSPSPRPTVLTAIVAATAIAAPGGARGAPLVEPSIALGVDAAYDSNVYNGRGPDYVTRITPRLALRVRDRRVDLKASYDLGIWLYAFGRARSSINHQGRLALEARLTRRLTLKLADEIVYAGDPGFLLRAGVVAPQTSIFDNIAEAEIDYAISRRVAAAVSYAYRHTVFGEAPAGSPPLFGGDEHAAAAALDARLTRHFDLRISNRFAYFTADGVSLAMTDAPALGFRLRARPWLELRAEAGPLFFEVLDDGRRLTEQNAERRSGTTWRGAARIRFARGRYRAVLSASRELVGGTGAASVLWANFLGARFGVRVERRVDLQAGVAVFANGFAPSERRLYDGLTTDALLDVTVLPGVRVGLYYSFRYQEVIGDGAPLPGITRHIVGARVVGVWGEEAGPPRRLRAPE